MAVGQGPWHSVNSDIYHDNPDCLVHAQATSWGMDRRS